MLDKLWIRLLVAFVLVLFVAVGTASLYANHVTTGEFQDYVSENAARLNQRVQRIVERTYREQGWQGVAPYVQRVAEASNLQIVIVDQQGTVVIDTGGRLSGDALAPSSKTKPVPSLPIADSAGAPIGTIYFGSNDQARAEAFLADMNHALMLGAALGALVAFGLSLLLARRIVDPIERLTAVVQKMEQGDLGQRVENIHSGEVAKLSHAFNAMVEGLERGQRLRRNMVADVAHELRTPLHNVLGYLELLRDGVSQPTGEMIATIYEEASLLKRLVDDLQQLALAESGQLELVRREVSPSSLLQQAAAMVRPELNEKNIEMVVEATPGLPDITVDEGRIRQVLRNLVSNAIASTPRGGRITLSANRVDVPEKAVVMAVEDTGPGIAAEDLPYVFERFYRADKSRTRATGGAGLGLTIAKQLVEAHGGAISAESEPGRGACFRFVLPVQSPLRDPGQSVHGHSPDPVA